ncbi:hypothetical protein [Cryobacterium sp. HLT2-28]|uniref:hypothetical protein n=1 Tax=Cryobacterium sp. HLT2-28 TaxID=1259146 RepID=UPI00106B49F0|nr:hypothetical protein [Cryobacterium sp. HLT2-28]TFB92774.1 hypothetical protein E3O48_13510 [Cryobacterium sp. HLT2-28]
MSAARESRLTVNEAAREPTRNATTSSLKPNSSNPTEPAGKIGARVETHLDATLWKLKAGEIGLHDLTPALMGFYSIGHSDGIASVAPQLEQALADRDRYYRAAFDPRSPIKIGPSHAELQATRRATYERGAE